MVRKRTLGRVLLVPVAARFLHLLHLADIVEPLGTVHSILFKLRVRVHQTALNTDRAVPSFFRSCSCLNFGTSVSPGVFSNFEVRFIFLDFNITNIEVFLFYSIKIQ